MRIDQFNPKIQAQIREQLVKAPKKSVEHKINCALNADPRDTGIYHCTCGAESPAVEIRTNLAMRPTTDELGLNKTERQFYSYLQMLNYFWIGVQNITLKMAHDTRYTCDFYAIGFDGELIGFECKGHMEDDARVKLFTVARQFPWIRFKLVRKIKNGWDITDVKP